MTENTNLDAIIGYFKSEDQAELAVTELTSAGFRADQLGVAGRWNEQRNDTELESAGRGSSSSTGETVRSGHQAESWWERLKSSFEGSSSEAEIAPAVGTENSGDYDDYDFDSSLQNLNIPQEQRGYFDYQLQSNPRGAVAVVRAAERVEEARQILKRNGADLGGRVARRDFTSALSQNRT